MAVIDRIRLSANRVRGAGGRWDVTVRYTARFSPFEVNGGQFTFRDGFVLEEDDPLLHDPLTGVVAVSTFNPTDTEVERTLTHRIDRGPLDGELGPDELFAVVRLRNVDLNLVTTGQSSPVRLSP
jgi:hypothetical protein